MGWKETVAMAMIGVKAVLKDAHQMAQLNVDCIEILPTAEELENKFEYFADTFKKIITRYNLYPVIHTPEYLTNGKLVDLCSLDGKHRHQSVETVKKTLVLAERLQVGKVIIHPGGVVHASRKGSKKSYLYNLEKSLSLLRSERLLLENMPWFYWLSDGSLGKCMVCKFPADFENILQFVGGINLDICHAYLSTKKGGYETIQRFIELYKGKILHVHVSDALPPDGEGLQIGDGEIDFKFVLGMLDKRANICYLPEISDGHRNGGAGFKVGIARLRKLLAVGAK